jgi:hypothetical protein
MKNSNRININSWIYTATGFPNTIGKKRGSRYAVVLILIVIFYLLYLLFSQRNTIPGEHLFLGSIVVILGIIPTFLYFWQGMKDSVPLMALHGLFYTFSFGFVAFAEINPFIRPGDEYLTKALACTIAGLVLLYIGYYVVGGLIFRSQQPFQFPSRVAINEISLWGWIFESFYLVWLIYFSGTRIPSIEQFVPVLGWLGKGILLYQFFKGNMPVVGRILLWGGVIPYELIAGVATGAFANVVIILIFIGVVILSTKKRLPVFIIILSLISVIISQPIKGEYRSVIWGGLGSHLNVFEKTHLFLTIAKEYYIDKQSFAQASSSFFSRTDHLGTTAAIVAQTPQIIPYFYGFTYINLSTSWIPRIAWPNKPMEDFGNVWAKWYGLLGSSDFETSYNLPWLPEFYMNFGLLGILGGMLLVGVFFRFLAIKFCSEAHSPIEFLVGLTLTFRLFVAESNLSGMIGSIIPIFVALYITMRIISAARIRY